MKLSIWSSYFHDLSPEEMIKTFSKNGYEYAEISTEHADELLKRGNPSKVGAELKSYASEYGLSFPQGHLKLSADICGENSRQDIDELKNWLELFKALGVQSAVLHSGGYNIQNSISPEALLEMRTSAISELTDYISGTDMFICLENLRNTTQNCTSLLEIIDAVNSPNLGICLDTGHLNICNGDQGDFIRQAGIHLKALHIADNEGMTDQHMMPFGRGTVNWEDVMSALEKINYNDIFNYEIPGESRAPIEIRISKLKYIKDVSEYLFTYGKTK